MPRKAIVGVMGGNRSEYCREAKDLAGILAKSGVIVLTGGEGMGIEKDKNIKDAAAFGALQVGGSVISILSTTRDPPMEIVGGQLKVKTGLSSCKRDPMNALTPDSLVFFPGGSGTLCELAFAIHVNKPILLWGGKWTIRSLLDNKVSKETVTCIEEGVSWFREGTETHLVVHNLVKGLDTRPNATDITIAELADGAIRLAGGIAHPEETGFPWLDCKKEFERLVGLL